MDRLLSCCGGLVLEADQMKDRSFVAGKPHQRGRLVQGRDSTLEKV